MSSFSTKMVLVAVVLLTAVSLCAQDVHPAGSGAIQGVRPGISQGVNGAIARRPGGERSGTGGFGTSEVQSHLVSGKVAGYGGRQLPGGQGEYASQSGASFGGNRDFPATDFVATMPEPKLGAGPAMAGFSTSPINLGGHAPHHAAGASHAGMHSKMKDPDAILNPFTHPIGPSLAMPGVGSLGGSGLGASH